MVLEELDGLNVEEMMIGVGKEDSIVLDKKKITKARQYVLFNCNSIQSFIEEHKAEVKRENPRLSKKNVEQVHSETFAKWFDKHMLSTDTICEEGQDSTFFNTIYLQGCLGRRWKLMSIVRSQRYGSLSPFYLFLGNLLGNLLSWKVNYNVSLLLLFHKLCTFVINV
ncbi:hypothetical protein ACJIZ3_023855 [Penstemon smallii]|uniref:Uncharacterized protein n=1 Tax=Penstemon smallii TaxID=265156 RepID=A0ABD3TQ68_9LAMI